MSITKNGIVLVLASIITQDTSFFQQFLSYLLLAYVVSTVRTPPAPRMTSPGKDDKSQKKADKGWVKVRKVYAKRQTDIILRPPTHPPVSVKIYVKYFY